MTKLCYIDGKNFKLQGEVEYIYKIKAEEYLKFFIFKYNQCFIKIENNTK